MLSEETAIRFIDAVNRLETLFSPEKKQRKNITKEEMIIAEKKRYAKKHFKNKI